MKALRVPAGVYVDGVAMGGRYASPDMLGALVADAEGDGAERLLAVIFDRYDRAHEAHERAERQFDDDPKRYAHKRADAEQAFVAWRAAAQEAGEYGRKELEDLEDEEPDESFADEWEIGFEYQAGHLTSDVDVNLRIRRVDGAPMPQSEAKQALSQFRDALAAGLDPVPPGYLMASINWRRPSYADAGWHKRGQKGTGWRPFGGGSGTKGDLDSFNNPMYAHHDRDGAWDINPHGPVRMGSVKK